MWEIKANGGPDRPLQQEPDRMDGSKPARLPPASAVATFLFFVAIMGTRPIAALYAVELGMSTAEIGGLAAVFALLSLFGASTAGAWMDLRGARSVLRTGIVLAAAGMLLPWLLPGRAGIYLSQLVAGSGFTLYTIAAQRLAGNVGANAEESQRAITAFSFMVSLGSFAGPTVLGALAEEIGLKEAMLAMLVPLGVCFLLALRDEDTPRDQRAAEDMRLWSNPVDSLSYHSFMLRAFMISTFVLLARDSFMAFFPLYAREHGVSTSWIGIIVGLHNLGSLVARAALMPCVRLLGRNRTVIGSIVLAGAFCLVIPFADTLTLMIIAAFGVGVGLGVGQPLSIAMTTRLAPRNRVGEVLGARLTFNRLTQIVAPLGFGAASAQIGLSGIFWLTGAIMILGAPRLSIPDTVLSDPPDP